MGGVDDDGQVRLLLEHRDRADVEREAGRRLERRMPRSQRITSGVALLTMYSAAINRSSIVAGEPALEQHRLRRAADLGEEREVRHVAGADLDHVGRLDDGLDVARIHQLGDDRQPGLYAPR